MRTAWDYQDECGTWRITTSPKGCDAVAAPEEVRQILTQWRELLDGVRDDPESVADRIDWVAKLRIIRGSQERHSLAPTAMQLHAIDLQYHDLRPERSLAQRAGLRALHAEEAVREAVHNPPRRRGPTFGASAWRATRMRSSRRTGIRSSSISVKDRYNACPCSIL